MMFETILLRQYECCRDALRLSDTKLSSIAGTSLEVSSAPPEIAQRGYKETERWLTHAYE